MVWVKWNETCILQGIYLCDSVWLQRINASSMENCVLKTSDNQLMCLDVKEKSLALTWSPRHCRQRISNGRSDLVPTVTILATPSGCVFCYSTVRSFVFFVCVKKGFFGSQELDMHLEFCSQMSSMPKGMPTAQLLVPSSKELGSLKSDENAGLKVKKKTKKQASAMTEKSLA